MFKILFNAILGLILIFVWSKFVDLQQIFSTLSKANLIYLGPVILFMLLSPVIRAIRLKVFLSEIKKIKLLDLIFLNGAAMMLNFFIPIRAGEIVKGVYLNTNYNLPLGKSVIWIFMDRFVDFLAVLVLAAVLFFIVPTTLDIKFITVIAIILISALILTYLMVFKAHFAKKLFNFLQAILIVNSIKIYFDRFSLFILESFSILNRHPKDLGLMTGITILAYGADAAVWYFTFMALGVNQVFLKMYLGQLLSALTYLVPAAPGYVGSAEASGLLILSGVFGIPPNLASAMIVLFHITSAVFVLIFGLISIYYLKIEVGTLLKKVLKRD
ncbi:MAG: lysylphosphatidylglycerol synthase transmembrane domain-containing protein [Candidatus Daviesbacteria bacterium]|nr:lysylphosphatidylglycerol synthase transmembrane domain-containing protein [Candidatus Daviesbacteria bacterium]